MNDVPQDTWTRRLRNGDIDLVRDFHTDSPVMKAFLAELKLFIPGRRPLLLFGEPGVGKTAIARAIHRLSDFKEGPFVRICISEIEEHLVRSELCGHVKGAFTGATADRKGLFELANKGTALIDECFEGSETDQKLFLRILDSHEILPVGATKPIYVNFRPVIASNRSYAQVLADAARWRRDYLSRLGLGIFTVPSLHERMEDLPMLVTQYVLEVSQKDGRSSPPIIDSSTLRALAKREYKWNLRELYNTIEAALPRCTNGVLLPEHLPVVGAIVPARASICPLDIAMRDFAKRALRACDGNWTEAARLLGIWPKRLRRIIGEEPM